MMGHSEDARMMKALADENRLSILELLQDGEKCACVLLEELNITQPTLSHHMKILCDSGIVEGRRDGKWTHYSLSAEGSGKLKERILYYTAGADTGGRNIKCDACKR
ncbi:MAG TPA: metalloregulator ArsR/SmtB family transcription factor [Lachnospiraceae bacterium]|nr:metalloregulator ArsR/SmtB family transcription factor [Lachnospiraceae bacterium]